MKCLINYLILILSLFLTISCTNYQIIHDSIQSMDESVSNIENNNKNINKLCLKLLENLIELSEANRIMKMDIVYSDFALGRIKDPDILTLELAKINEITNLQKEKVKKQIQKFKEDIDLSGKNYISYKEISLFLLKYIKIIGEIKN